MRKMLLWCLVSCSAVHAAGSDERLIREVMSASEARMQAFNRRDVATLTTLIAEEGLLTNDVGMLASRDEVLRQISGLRSPQDDQFGRPTHVLGRAFGNAVILQYQYEERERFGDHDIVSLNAALETWQKQSGHWRLLAKSVTPIPVNHRPSMQDPPPPLNDYVGIYEWRPGLQDEVSIESGHLVSRYGGSPPTPLRFIAPDVQVSDDDLGRSYMQRDAAGHVTGYRFERADGQWLFARKIR